MENQEKALREEREFLTEQPTMNTDPAGTGNPGFSGTGASPVAGFDPVLISLIRRAMPNLVAYDLAGVQPMNGPTGLIFAMRSRLEGPTGNETFYNEVDSAFSGQNEGRSLTGGMVDGAVGLGTTTTAGTSNPGLLDPSVTSTSVQSDIYPVGQGMKTQDSEALDGTGAAAFHQMAFSIEKVTVTAKSRALK
ncbi:MAG: ATP-binding protein, partial [Pseudomonadota bacterium]|nr:ATP-binding protein [Pseudomonadota bacterium]